MHIKYLGSTPSISSRPALYQLHIYIYIYIYTYIYIYMYIYVCICIELRSPAVQVPEIISTSLPGPRPRQKLPGAAPSLG